MKNYTAEPDYLEVKAQGLWGIEDNLEAQKNYHGFNRSKDCRELVSRMLDSFMISLNPGN